MLTTQQLQTLRSAIDAETAPVVVQARTAGNNTDIASFYNGASSFVVWRSTMPASEIQDAIAWANMTPADAPDGSEVGKHRELRCQSKQFNLQNLIVGRDSISVGKSNIRAGLQDALTNIPSGAGGAVQAANWVAVRTAMQRAANRVEALFATGAGTSATPGSLVYEGAISREDIIAAFAS